MSINSVRDGCLNLWEYFISYIPNSYTETYTALNMLSCFGCYGEERFDREGSDDNRSNEIRIVADYV